MDHFWTATAPSVEDQAREAARQLERLGAPYLVVVRGATLKVLTGPDREAALGLLAELQAGALSVAVEGLAREP